MHLTVRRPGKVPLEPLLRELRRAWDARLSYTPNGFGGLQRRQDVALETLQPFFA